MSAAIIRILWESQGAFGERLDDVQLMEISKSGDDVYKALSRVAELMRDAGREIENSQGRHRADAACGVLRCMADVVEMYGEAARISDYASAIRANRALEKKTPRPTKVEPSEHLH